MLLLSSTFTKDGNGQINMMTTCLLLLSPLDMKLPITPQGIFEGRLEGERAAVSRVVYRYQYWQTHTHKHTYKHNPYTDTARQKRHSGVSKAKRSRAEEVPLAAACLYTRFASENGNKTVNKKKITP